MAAWPYRFSPSNRLKTTFKTGLSALFLELLT